MKIQAIGISISSQHVVVGILVDPTVGLQELVHLLITDTYPHVYEEVHISLQQGIPLHHLGKDIRIPECLDIGNGHTFPSQRISEYQWVSKGHRVGRVEPCRC